MNKPVNATSAKNVSEYLEMLPPDVRTLLEKVRQAIKAAAPKAEEVISYQIPTYKSNGPVVHFAAFKDHCSFTFVSENILKVFRKELAPFEISGRTIHFSTEKPLPAGLIQKIVKTRMKENEKRIAASKSGKVKKSKDKISSELPTKKRLTEKKKNGGGKTEINAKIFIERLKLFQSDKELEKIQRYFKSGKGEYGEGDRFMGVRMGQVFAVAKTCIEMPPAEIEKLLESKIHEVRAGAVSIMDFQARSKKTSTQRRKELFDLYLRRHDRINNWDLVDRSAPYVVGGFLFDKSRDILYRLAVSKNIWERRTAIVSTFYFIRKRDVDDTFKIAEILLHDEHDLIHKAAGGWLREAGKKDPQKLLKFLDKYSVMMPRTMLRYAIERFDKKLRDYYLTMKQANLVSRKLR